MRCNKCGKLQVYCDCEVSTKEIKNSMHIVKHIKTGNFYYIIHDEATDTTNKRDGTLCIVYMNVAGKVFVRDYKEFWKKFCSLSDNELGSLKIVMEQ